MTLSLFLGVLGLHILAAISPGPSFVMSLRIAASEGFRAAAAFALGLGLGALIWAGAALFGLALLFTILPALHTGLRIVGGLFLLYIAIQLWRHASVPPPQSEARAPRGIIGQITRGLATQLANPKPAVFFGAVFVGLVPPGTSVGWLVALLLLICLNETLWYVFVAFAFSRARARAAYLRLKLWADRVFAGLIGFIGVRIAMS